MKLFLSLHEVLYHLLSVPADRVLPSLCGTTESREPNSSREFFQCHSMTETKKVRKIQQRKMCLRAENKT